RTGCSRPTASTAGWRIRCCSRSSPPRASAPWSKTPSSNPHRWATDTRQPRRTSMTDTHAQTWRDDFSRVLSPVFGSPQLDLVRGEGSYVWDASGKKYLDLLAGIAVNALGHAHPAWTAAIAEQASTLGHISNFFTSPAQIGLAEKLHEILDLPDGSAVFFSNSGTEANEAAFKM